MFDSLHLSYDDITMDPVFWYQHVNPMLMPKDVLVRFIDFHSTDIEPSIELIVMRDVIMDWIDTVEQIMPTSDHNIIFIDHDKLNEFINETRYSRDDRTKAIKSKIIAHFKSFKKHNKRVANANKLHEVIKHTYDFLLDRNVGYYLARMNDERWFNITARSIGVRIQDLPKRFTGYVSRASTFRNATNTFEHFYPNQWAGSVILTHIAMFKGMELSDFQQYIEVFRQVHLTTRSENMSLLKHQKVGNFTSAKDAYERAGIELLQLDGDYPPLLEIDDFAPKVVLEEMGYSPSRSKV